MVKVVAARVRLPVFSVAHPESFQVLSALPVPQPSSLVGALAYALGVSTGKGTKAWEEAFDLVRHGRLLAARAKPGGGRGFDPPLIPSPTVVRRFRVADKGHESKKKGEKKPVEKLVELAGSGGWEEVKRIVEIELTDAFYREYVMGVDLFCVWVFQKFDLDERVVGLVHRLGDTESLCTVVDLYSTEAPVERTSVVTTSFPAPWFEGARVLEGTYLPAKMCDEARRLGLFIVPLKYEIERRGRFRYPAIRESIVKIDYGREVNVCRTDWGDVVLGG
ncbi:MAG: type I-A CRISPR-associated protein Cas5a [Thermofilaceae archaeon]|nr:type I-A CRISPR-associated protein Cas5a [Thermofilaceae archaeon]MDW8004688.1 type I-A CRISPR-associated protein Cas5a [Thermofilaceae archaeon]